MSNIIQLEHYKRKKLGDNGFKYWNAQFRQSFNESTRISDLPDNILLFLASPGDKSAGAIYQLVEQVKYPTAKSEDKADTNRKEMDLMDIHLYLVDKIRFEMMVRLGWIENYLDMDSTLLDLILNYTNSTAGNFDSPPQLSDNHPRLAEYSALITREKELFIRKLFVNALIEFNQKIRE